MDWDLIRAFDLGLRYTTGLAYLAAIPVLLRLMFEPKLSRSSKRMVAWWLVFWGILVVGYAVRMVVSIYL